MILIYVLMILFTAWMFWGWMVGESHEIYWMRNWCASIFVGMSVLMCLGGGAKLTRKYYERSQRESIQQLSQLLKERFEQGRIEDVKDAISHIADNPDEWSTHSPDVLQRMADVTAALEKTSHSRVAVKPKSVQ
jgi:uncharacterized membrane protein